MGTARSLNNEERFIAELVGTLGDNPLNTVEKDGNYMSYVLTKELPALIADGWRLTNAKSW
jgi:hypothetical protein